MKKRTRYIWKPKVRSSSRRHLILGVILISLIVNSLSELLKIERSILNSSDEANDEGTNSMMSDFITQQEKTVWMMKAWLNETV